MSPTGTKARQFVMSAKICRSGLRDDTNMKSSGRTKTSTRSTRATVTTTDRRRPVAALPLLAGAAAGCTPVGESVSAAMSDLLPGQEPLDRGHGEDEHEEHERDRRGVPGGELLVAGADGHEDERRGRVQRATLRHHVD